MLVFTAGKPPLPQCSVIAHVKTPAYSCSSNCYCADQYESALAVSRDLCSSVPCPGNPLEGCGGVNNNSTSNSTTAFLHRRDAGIKRRQGATGPVPANALLVVYEYSPLATPSTETATATAVVTATATATNCISGFCTGAGYIFEQCQGFPNAGELVFVIEACSCTGGHKYVPAGCDGSACGSLVVYRPVPCPPGATNVTVYQPQACTSCSGGVSFEQGTGTGSVPAKTTGVVVVAGASKLVSYLSSAMVAAGALALLL